MSSIFVMVNVVMRNAITSIIIWLDRADLSAVLSHRMYNPTAKHDFEKANSSRGKYKILLTTVNFHFPSRFHSSRNSGNLLFSRVKIFGRWSGYFLKKIRVIKYLPYGQWFRTIANDNTKYSIWKPNLLSIIVM